MIENQQTDMKNRMYVHEFSLIGSHSLTSQLKFEMQLQVILVSS